MRLQRIESSAGAGRNVGVAHAIVMLVAMAALVSMSAPAWATRASRGLRDRLEEVRAKADAAFQSGHADSAHGWIAGLLPRARNDRDSLVLFQLLRMDGEIQVRSGSPKTAVPLLREAVAVGSRRADSTEYTRAVLWLAVSLERQGRGGEAARWYRLGLVRARRFGDREQVAWALTGLAYHDYQSGQNERARREYETASSTFESLGNLRGQVRALTGLGNVLSRTGEPDAAKRCYARILGIARDQGFAWAEGQALNNLGVIAYSQGDPATAARYFREAYEQQDRLGDEREKVTPATNLVLAYLDLGRLDDAEKLVDEARDICERGGYMDLYASTLVEIGELYGVQGRSRRSAALFRQAMSLAAGRSVRARAEAGSGLSLALDKQDSARTALRVVESLQAELGPRIPVSSELLLERSHAQCLLDLDRPVEAAGVLRRACRRAAEIGETSQQLELLTLLARALRASGRSDSAMVVLRRAVNVWESERALPDDRIWRERRGAAGHQIYTQWAALRVGPQDREGPRVEQAFGELQRFKARSLIEVLAGPGRPPTRLDWVGEGAFDLAEFRQDVMTDGDLLLDAYVGPDESFLFALTRRACRVIRLPGAARLAREVGLVRDLLSAPPASHESAGAGRARERALEAIEQTLLGGVEDLLAGARRVVLAPDDVLDLLPLAALPVISDAESGTAPLAAGREVVYVPSATVWQQVQARSRQEPPHDSAHMLAVAGGGESGRDALPGARREVDALFHRYAGVERLEGDNGRRARLSAEALGSYDLIHMAVHATVDDQSPWRSSLMLALEDSTNGTGPLSARTIAGLDLHARLVVLSACKSAAGRILNGEGVIGLTTAFLSAGVPTVLATLWPVDDRVTADFMRDFYSELAKGHPAADALRRAQMAVRARPETAHPFYWAGFVLVGDGSARVALNRRAPGTVAVAGGLTLLIAIAGLALAARKRRRTEL